MTPEISIIIPTRHRSKYLGYRLQTIFENTREFINRTAEIILVTDNDDEDSDKAIITSIGQYDPLIIKSKPLELPCNKWNQAAKIASGEWLVTLSDDCIPEPNWLTAALDLISYGFIGLPDGVTGDRNNKFTPLYMATKSWLRRFNGGFLVPPYYESWFGDMEIAWKARRVGHYLISKHSVVKQLHVDFKTAEDDEIYMIGRNRRVRDLQVFNLRASQGFKDEVRGEL